MKTSITIKEIQSKSDLKKFIGFPEKLYKGNTNYVPVLRSEEFKTLSSDKNPAHEFCVSKYWLAYRNGKIVGRVAGIINKKYNENRNIKYARFGWLDFINDLESTEFFNGLYEVDLFYKVISSSSIQAFI